MACGSAIRTLTFRPMAVSAKTSSTRSRRCRCRCCAGPAAAMPITITGATASASGRPAWGCRAACRSRTTIRSARTNSSTCASCWAQSRISPGIWAAAQCKSCATGSNTATRRSARRSSASAALTVRMSRSTSSCGASATKTGAAAVTTTSRATPTSIAATRPCFSTSIRLPNWSPAGSPTSGTKPSSRSTSVTCG